MYKGLLTRYNASLEHHSRISFSVSSVRQVFSTAAFSDFPFFFSSFSVVVPHPDFVCFVDVFVDDVVVVAALIIVAVEVCEFLLL